MDQHHGDCIFEINPPELNIQIFAGWNFRISEISNAILLIQLRKLEVNFIKFKNRKKVD
jgi:dTDP-4-amino-4,6-dideoxygalactose transaminase